MAKVIATATFLGYAVKTSSSKWFIAYNTSNLWPARWKAADG